MTKSILILDDDITFSEVLGRSFKQRGLSCFVTQDCAAAESVLAKHSPDYAVIDLKIDQESGLHFLSTQGFINTHTGLRQRSQCRSDRVLALASGPY